MAKTGCTLYGLDFARISLARTLKLMWSRTLRRFGYGNRKGNLQEVSDINNERYCSEVKQKPRKRRQHKDESDDDYEVSEDEEGHALPNPLIIRGPIGVGKTALVTVVCEEFGLHIIDVSPNERRNGAAVRQKISGALNNQRVKIC